MIIELDKKKQRVTLTRQQGRGACNLPGQARVGPLTPAPRGQHSRPPDQWMAQSNLYFPCGSQSGMALGRGGRAGLVPNIPALWGFKGESLHGLQSGKASQRQWPWRWILKIDEEFISETEEGEVQGPGAQAFPQRALSPQGGCA